MQRSCFTFYKIWAEKHGLVHSSGHVFLANFFISKKFWNVFSFWITLQHILHTMYIVHSIHSMRHNTQSHTECCVSIKIRLDLLGHRYAFVHIFFALQPWNDEIISGVSIVPLVQKFNRIKYYILYWAVQCAPCRKIHTKFLHLSILHILIR